MDIFRTLGSGSLSVSPMLDFSGKANTSINGLGKDDTACLRGLAKLKKFQTLKKFWIELTPTTHPPYQIFLFLETNLPHGQKTSKSYIITFILTVSPKDFIFFWFSNFLSKMALDPPTHFQIFLDVWNFLTSQHPLCLGFVLGWISLKFASSSETLLTNFTIPAHFLAVPDLRNGLIAGPDMGMSIP